MYLCALLFRAGLFRCNYSGVTTYSHARRGNSLWDALRPTRRQAWNEKVNPLTLTPGPSPEVGEGSWFPLPGERVRVRGRPGESGLRWFNYQAQLENCGLVKK